MNYFPTIDNGTGKLVFPLNVYGNVNPQFAKTLAQANSSLLLRYTVENDGMAPTGISVDPGTFLSLSTRFQTPVAAKELVNLFGQLTNLIKTLQSLGLPLMNVVFDTNYMYVTAPELTGLKCIYLPVAGGTKNINAAKDFFASLPTDIKPEGKQAQEMLSAFGTFMRNQDHLNVAALATFLQNLASAQVSNEDEPASHYSAPVSFQPSESTAPEIREAPGTMVLNAVEFADSPELAGEGTSDILNQTIQVPPISTASTANEQPIISPPPPRS